MTVKEVLGKTTRDEGVTSYIFLIRMYPVGAETDPNPGLIPHNIDSKPGHFCFSFEGHFVVCCAYFVFSAQSSDTKFGHLVFVQMACMSPEVIVFFKCIIQRIIQLYDSLYYSAYDSCSQRIFRVACFYHSVIPGG